MSLADIPLPEQLSGLTIREHDQRYPTTPDTAPDIVHMSESRVTVQCAACLATATGHTAWWVIVQQRWNHAPDDPESRHVTPYKRCPRCQAEGRHPTRPQQEP